MGSSRELWYIFLDLHFYEIFTQIVHFWVDKYVWTWVYTYKWCGTSGIASVPSRVYFSGTLLILESVLREHLKPLHQLTALLHYSTKCTVLDNSMVWFTPSTILISTIATRNTTIRYVNIYTRLHTIIKNILF